MWGRPGLGQNRGMRSTREVAGSPPGLRERKKARTRAAIRQHAMRLFREQGFQATTVDQIAEAADVSQSTFFRYFRTKEDVVLQDDYDPRAVEAFKAQPPELPPLAALRNAIRTVYSELTPQEMEQERQRHRLILEVPELRGAILDEYTRTIRVIADVVSERVGRTPDDPAVRAFAGAVIGVAMAATLTWAQGPPEDYFTVFESAIGYLEAGLPL